MASLLAPFLLLTLLICVLAVTGWVRFEAARGDRSYFLAWVLVALAVLALTIHFFTAAWFRPGDPNWHKVATKAELIAIVVQLVCVAFGFLCLGRFFQGSGDSR